LLLTVFDSRQTNKYDVESVSPGGSANTTTVALTALHTRNAVTMGAHFG